MTARSDEVLAAEELLAEGVYDRVVRPTLRPEDDGKYVAVAFDHGDFEIHADDYTAVSRLLARHPGARVWMMRVGQAAAYRLRSVEVRS
jgi:hypothetical protein